MEERLEENNPGDAMYYDDGSFRPFVGHHGNVSGEVENYRNTYLEAEREYFSRLLEDEEIRDHVRNFLYNYSPDQIFDEAMAIQERLETGQLETPEDIVKMQSMTPEERDSFHLHRLEQAEGMMCILFASVRDKALVLNEYEAWESRFEEMQSIGGRAM